MTIMVKGCIHCNKGVLWASGPDRLKKAILQMIFMSQGNGRVNGVEGVHARNIDRLVIAYPSLNGGHVADIYLEVVENLSQGAKITKHIPALAYKGANEALNSHL